MFAKYEQSLMMAIVDPQLYDGYHFANNIRPNDCKTLKNLLEPYLKKEVPGFPIREYKEFRFINIEQVVDLINQNITCDDTKKRIFDCINKCKLNSKTPDVELPSYSMWCLIL